MIDSGLKKGGGMRRIIPAPIIAGWIKPAPLMAKPGGGSFKQPLLSSVFHKVLYRLSTASVGKPMSMDRK
jgi:hypothetical protein